MTVQTTQPAPPQPQTQSQPQGQGSGDQQQQGQQQQGPAEGLLEQESHQQQQQGTEGAGNQTGGQQQQPPPAMTAAEVQAAIESGLDRRINAVLREIRGQGQQGQAPQGPAPGQQQQGAGQQGQQAPQGPHTPPGPDPGDLREARASYREAVADHVTFLGPVERDLAASIAAGLISTGLTTGGDADRTGREVAEKVAAQIKALRKHYETATLAALKRKGIIPADSGGQQPPPGGSAAGDQSTFLKGQEKAAAMFADRLPQKQ